MYEDMPDVTTRETMEVAHHNFELFAHIVVPIAMVCFLPWLETIHHLVKLSMDRDIFICDYLVAVKVCRGRLYSLYTGPTTLH